MALDKSSLRIDIFRNALDINLKHNLTEYLLSTISNMLGLHYASDEKLRKVEQNVAKYADDLSTKLKHFIGEEVIIDDSFDMAMNLFITAISPSMPNREDPPSIKNEKATILDVIKNICYPDWDLTLGESEYLESLVGTILASPNKSSIINLIEKEPGIVKSMTQKNTSIKNAVDTLSQAALSKKQNYLISSEFAQFAGIAACGFIAAAGGFLAATIAQSIAAAAIVPTIVVSIKYGSRIGEFVGNKLSEFEKGSAQNTKNLTEIIQNFVPNLKQPALSVSHEVKRENEIDKSNAKLNEIKEEVRQHIGTEKDLQNAQQMPQKKSKSIDISRNDL